MDDDVDAAEALVNRLGHCSPACGRSDIRGHKKVFIRKITWRLGSRNENPRTGPTQSRRYGLAYSSRAASNENTLTIKFMWNGGRCIKALHLFSLHRCDQAPTIGYSFKDLRRVFLVAFFIMLLARRVRPAAHRGLSKRSCEQPRRQSACH